MPGTSENEINSAIKNKLHERIVSNLVNVKMVHAEMPAIASALSPPFIFESAYN